MCGMKRVHLGCNWLVIVLAFYCCITVYQFMILAKFITRCISYFTVSLDQNSGLGSAGSFVQDLANLSSRCWSGQLSHLKLNLLPGSCRVGRVYLLAAVACMMICVFKTRRKSLFPLGCIKGFTQVFRSGPSRIITLLIKVNAIGNLITSAKLSHHCHVLLLSNKLQILSTHKGSRLPVAWP